ncbi:MULTISPECIES: TerC family protein [unclassified Arthrobacter]|uniref:TerC family protein n=1 Tax=unclassified Arthrobacter TaxID=235627 RepID=UPI00149147B0|nr:MULTISPECIES: TerC family protein [unclassified Arthrobacter]MBE0009218.1 TerC family protein [Arthrobacter sp. AET 35A]NOJ59017.1 TerC family protein [Arthrobacter sp. 260]NOJ62972.1 TerC family protein [Arthrobacter sp. 147(2020)]
MDVSPIVWALTIAGIVGLLLFDFFFHVRKAHTPTLKEAAVWSSIYVGIAILFGLGVLIFGGPTMGTEYFAGYVTEKALSVDNLFVFLIIMASFKVPRADQQKVLLFGIVFALIARTGFIFLGAALINQFAWIFYLFGLVLLMTAGNLLKPTNDDDHGDTIVVRLAKRFLPATDHYDGDKLFTIENGKRVLTPMLLVMIAIGGTDILFALDSIPAIFGLTQNVFIVFTATAFSLMGLRQLYFLIDGLLDRLIYLSYGLAIILGFIGVKLILHALHENNLPFINDGEPVPVVEISTGLSLTVILGVLAVTVLASIFSPKGKAKTAVRGAKRHATEYLDLGYETNIDEREKIFGRMVEEEKMLRDLPEKYKKLIRNETEFMDLIKKAHESHGAAVDREPTRESGVSGPTKI